RAIREICTAIQQVFHRPLWKTRNCWPLNHLRGRPHRRTRMFVKDAASSADKWSKRAANADKDYEKGVQGSGQRWLDGASAAEDAYKDGVNKAAANGRFGKGVRKDGATK